MINHGDATFLTEEILYREKIWRGGEAIYPTPRGKLKEDTNT